MIRRILHATDFSPASQAAFKKAVELAKQNRAELVVLHVMSPVVYTTGEGYMSPKMYDELAAICKNCTNMEDRAPGVRARGLLLEGLAQSRSFARRRPSAPTSW